MELLINRIEKVMGSVTLNGPTTVTQDMSIENNGNLTIGNNGSYSGSKITAKDDGIISSSGVLILSDQLQLKDDATLNFNNGSIGTIEDVKVEDDAAFNVLAGSDMTIENELQVKDDAHLNIGGTLSVQDDISFEDDALISLTGTLNLCDDDGTENNNDFDVDNGVTFSGNGTYCACATNNNNNYNNNSNSSAGITFNLNCNGPLPIELIKFENHLNEENKVEISWSTASEINNSHFEIQFSINNKEWYEIGRVKGAGNSNKVISYSIIHDISEITNDIIYYRIKNIDFDGRYAYSWIVSLENENQIKEFTRPISVYPNPISQGTTIRIKNVSLNTMSTSKLISLTGLEYSIKFTQLNEDVFEIETSSIPEGLYKLILKTNKEVQAKTIQIIS